MAIKSIPKSYYRYLGNGEINLSSDSFKLRLMSEDYVFDRNTHEVLDDVSSWEILHQNGYNGAYSLTQQIDDSDTYSISFGSILVTACGGVISFKSVILYDDTAIDKPLVGCYEFITPRIINAGDSYSLGNIRISIGR